MTDDLLDRILREKDTLAALDRLPPEIRRQVERRLAQKQMEGVPRFHYLPEEVDIPF